jgi:hypothetical protein
MAGFEPGPSIYDPCTSPKGQFFGTFFRLDFLRRLFGGKGYEKLTSEVVKMLL